MGMRPRTDHVMKLKSRRCPKCGGKINSQKTRCKRCHEAQGRPKKRGKANG
jgi:ribosomal protein L40E